MSFVSVIATKRFITVMSDGLVVNTETGEELNQRYKKFTKISEKQFVAYGGNQGVAQKVVEVIGYNDAERNLFDISNKIRSQLISEIKPSQASCQLVIGGIENNEIVLYSFNNDANQELLIQKPRGIDGVYSFLSSSKLGLNLDDEMSKLYSVYGFNTPTRALKIQKELNDIVAQYDPSVNRITFNLTIRR